MDLKKLEILAPAGNEECAYSAINAGANAIYLGLTNFSARDSADNFDIVKLKNLCAYAAVLNVKIYVALNTVVKDSEVNDFINSAVLAHNAGAAAIIIQDIYLGAAIKKRYPQITLHLSTQAGTCNIYLAQMAKDFGFSRVILARETPISEIEKISSIIECETFVQGALCTCFSGQCYFSSFVGGNSGNRGKCKQPCRKKYSWNREGFNKLAYRLSLADLSVGEDIQKLISAGVTSFKIEGRLRKKEYVASAVKYYKNLLEGNASERDKINLKRAYNRGNYTKGLAFGQDKSFISSSISGHIGEYIGTVAVKNGKFICLTKTACSSGDGFKTLRAGEEVCGAVYGEAAGGGFTLNCRERLKNGDKVFLTTDSDLYSNLNIIDKKLPIEIKVNISIGSPVEVIIGNKKYFSDDVAEASIKQPITKEDVVRCFRKVDKFPFEVKIDVNILGDVFIPSSKLNAIRRYAYQSYYNSFLKIDEVVFEPLNFTVKTQNNNKLAVISRNLNGVNVDTGILKPDNYGKIDEKLYKNFHGEKFLYLPPFMTSAELEGIKSQIAPFDGIYCDGVWGEYFSKSINKLLFAGTGFNITNGLSLGGVTAKYIAVSKELTQNEAKKLAAPDVFYLTAGDIKLMDLIYCPFEKTCSKCDKKGEYILTDENGRNFPVRRYVSSECRFELYNCNRLLSVNNFCGALCDCTFTDAKQLTSALNNEDKLKKVLNNFTRGHTVNAIL